MADDKLKRGQRSQRPRSETCGTCEKPPRYLCPTCPRRVAGEYSDDDHGWKRLRARDPAEYAVQYPCALAARRLAITHESHMLYPQYLEAYRAACDARDRCWAAKRATLPKPQGTRHAAFQSPADAAREAVA